MEEKGAGEIISYKCTCVYNYPQNKFNLIKKKKPSRTKHCSVFWIWNTLPTKTDLKSYHTSRIRGGVVSGEGQEIKKKKQLPTHFVPQIS